MGPTRRELGPPEGALSSKRRVKMHFFLLSSTDVSDSAKDGVCLASDTFPPPSQASAKQLHPREPFPYCCVLNPTMRSSWSGGFSGLALSLLLLGSVVRPGVGPSPWAFEGHGPA